MPTCCTVLAGLPSILRSNARGAARPGRLAGGLVMVAGVALTLFGDRIVAAMSR